MPLYEGMFLIDNDNVRAGWSQAKTDVADLIKKHNGTVVTARRWDERPLAYPIKGKHRATYLLSYFEMEGDSIPPFHRDLEITDRVLRYLQLRVDALPEGEQELSDAENADDFTVPEPPKDTPPPIAPELFAVRDERPPRRRDEESTEGKPADEKPADGEAKAEGGDGEAKAEGDAPKADAPAEETKAPAEAAAPAAETATETKEG